MNTRFVARFAVLATAVLLLAGCSGTAGDAGSAGKPLQLRLVTSSVDGACTVPALTTDGPASACGSTGAVTYQLGKSLGTITPTSVTLAKDQGPAHMVVLELNSADTATLGTVSGEAMDKKLAIILDGRVLSAPNVKAAITTSPINLAFGTAAEAKQAVADLSASATH